MREREKENENVWFAGTRKIIILLFLVEKMTSEISSPRGKWKPADARVCLPVSSL